MGGFNSLYILCTWPGVTNIFSVISHKWHLRYHPHRRIQMKLYISYLYYFWKFYTYIHVTHTYYMWWWFLWSLFCSAWMWRAGRSSSSTICDRKTCKWHRNTTNAMACSLQKGIVFHRTLVFLCSIYQKAFKVTFPIFSFKNVTLEWQQDLGITTTNQIRVIR